MNVRRAALPPVLVAYTMTRITAARAQTSREEAIMSEQRVPGSHSMGDEEPTVGGDQQVFDAPGEPLCRQGRLPGERCNEEAA